MVGDGNRDYFLASLFDEAKDEYRDHYDIYEMPELSEAEKRDSWKGIELKAKQYLGRVSVSSIRFDATKRKQIDLQFLKNLQPNNA
jgi:hypothetical protein